MSATLTPRRGESEQATVTEPTQHVRCRVLLCNTRARCTHVLDDCVKSGILILSAAAAQPTVYRSVGEYRMRNASMH